MRDGFPVLLTMLVIRFHGLKDENVTLNTEEGNQESYILQMKQQLRSVHGTIAPCGSPRLA
jgi:hypothetical protein